MDVLSQCFDRLMDWPTAVTVADLDQDDLPLIYSNKAFSNLTGYSIDEITGRNCRFLQGADTDRETVATLRSSIEDRTASITCILNYTKDGEPFHNLLVMGPIDRIDYQNLIVGCQFQVKAGADQTTMQQQIRRVRGAIGEFKTVDFSGWPVFFDSVQLKSDSVMDMFRVYLIKAKRQAMR